MRAVRAGWCRASEETMMRRRVVGRTLGALWPWSDGENEFVEPRRRDLNEPTVAATTVRTRTDHLKGHERTRPSSRDRQRPGWLACAAPCPDVGASGATRRSATGDGPPSRWQPLPLGPFRPPCCFAGGFHPPRPPNRQWRHQPDRARSPPPCHGRSGRADPPRRWRHQPDRADRRTRLRCRPRHRRQRRRARHRPLTPVFPKDINRRQPVCPPSGGPVFGPGQRAPCKSASNDSSGWPRMCSAAASSGWIIGMTAPDGSHERTMSSAISVAIRLGA